MHLVNIYVAGALQHNMIQGPYYLPNTELFAGFCQNMVNAYGVGDVVRKGAGQRGREGLLSVFAELCSGGFSGLKPHLRLQMCVCVCVCVRVCLCVCCFLNA